MLLQAPSVVKPKVVSISMFKNGYAFVTREIPITDNSAKVVEVPQTSLGSLWFWTNEGQIDSVTSVDEGKTVTTKVPFSMYQEVLDANIGKRFVFTVVYTDEKDGHKSERRVTYDGVLRSYKSNLVAVETSEGMQLFAFDKIEDLVGKDPNIVLAREDKHQESARYYQVLTKNNAKSVMMMSLERGMAWAPGYSIDLSAPDKLTFTAKSTVLNDLLDFQGAKVRLITGFPNLQFQNILDPLTSGMSVDDWLASISGGAPGGFGGGGRGAGGFGGSFANRAGELTRRDAAAGLTIRSASPEDINNLKSITDGGLVAQDVAGEQLEDLFFYDLENISLKKGSRSYQYLYQFDVPYKRTYTWDGEQGSGVLNKIKFKNQTGKPISTAAATMFKKGEVVGQGMMNYTAANTEAELVVSRSLDFKTSVSTDLIDRNVGAIKDKKGNPTMDLITYETELEVENPKTDAVDFSIKKTFLGEVNKSEPKAEMDVSKTGLKGSNPYSVLTWNLKLGAGETQKFTVRYKVYVPTGQ
ncbi:MAG: hypothetical protein JST51_13885 [Armatimonadetes bacterium]|nr:hypothetical protein [Armatimonadota bacterium]